MPAPLKMFQIPFNMPVSNHAQAKPFSTLFLFFVSALFTFTACQKETKVDEDAAKAILNVSYGTDTAQKMDVYLPANRSAANTKVVVLVHGGSWTSGNKVDLAAYIDSFKRRLPDLAIINIGYRLASSTRTFPVPEQDVNAAVAFIADNAEAWGISKANIGLLGVSAGAHLALLQAYKQSNLVRIKAVVDFFGPTDLTAMYRQPWHPLVTALLQMITGATPETNEAIYQNSSPVNFVTAQSPPTLILHGTADEVVDISQSQALKARLDAAGVPNQMLVYPGEGHGWFGPKMTHSFNQVEAFLRTHL